MEPDSGVDAADSAAFAGDPTEPSVSDAVGGETGEAAVPEAPGDAVGFEDGLCVSDGGEAVRVPSVIEALLFATDRPLKAVRIVQILGVGDAREVKRHIAALNARYERVGASFRIESIAQGFRMMTLPAYDHWVGALVKARQQLRISAAAMETLAIVAYKQPVMRVDVEAVRGVACGEMLVRLREMNLVKIVGRAEVLGRPMLYGTTRRFLEVFGLASLKDLPKIEDLPPPRTPVATAPARAVSSEAAAEVAGGQDGAMGQAAPVAGDGADASSGPVALDVADVRPESDGAEDGGVRPAGDGRDVTTDGRVSADVGDGAGAGHPGGEQG